MGIRIEWNFTRISTIQFKSQDSIDIYETNSANHTIRKEVGGCINLLNITSYILLIHAMESSLHIPTCKITKLMRLSRNWRNCIPRDYIIGMSVGTYLNFKRYPVHLSWWCLVNIPNGMVKHIKFIAYKGANTKP